MLEQEKEKSRLAVDLDAVEEIGSALVEDLVDLVGGLELQRGPIDVLTDLCGEESTKLATCVFGVAEGVFEQAVVDRLIHVWRLE
jgi:hypothetical protein